MAKNPQDDGEQRLMIDTARLDPEGETLTGTADAVDLDEPFFKSVGPLRYRLDVRIAGSELLVRGVLEQDFALVCSRCNQTFKQTVIDGEYLYSCPVPDTDPVVDLTADARECIILSLPSYPVCDPDCPGLPQKTALPIDDRWSALDVLPRQ